MSLGWCRGGFHGAADVHDLTPYAAWPDSYVRTKRQLPAVGGLWRAALYPAAIAAMHFKWHSGVIRRRVGMSLVEAQTAY